MKTKPRVETVCCCSGSENFVFHAFPSLPFSSLQRGRQHFNSDRRRRLLLLLLSFPFSPSPSRVPNLVFPCRKYARQAEEEEEEPAPRISSLANMSGVGGGGRGNTHVNPRTVKFLVLDGGCRANWHYNIFPPKKGRKTLLAVLLQCVGRCCATFCRLPPCSLP